MIDCVAVFTMCYALVTLCYFARRRFSGEGWRMNIGWWSLDKGGGVVRRGLACWLITIYDQFCYEKYAGYFYLLMKNQALPSGLYSKNGILILIVNTQVITNWLSNQFGKEQFCVS